MAKKTWLVKDGTYICMNASGAHTEGAEWTLGDTYEGALDIGTDFYATIDIPATGTRAGVDSDTTSAIPSPPSGEGIAPAAFSQLNNRGPLKTPFRQSARSFVPTFAYKNLEIHTVFLRFLTQNLKQNFWAPARN